MSVGVQVGQAIAFDQFWAWLKLHTNCILRAGTVECFLYDHEALHWQLEEDPDGNPNLLLILGKVVIGELVLETNEVLYVQVSRDKGTEEPQFIFEVVGGPREEPYPLYQFVLTHGFEGEEAASHPPALKH